MTDRLTDEKYWTSLWQGQRPGILKLWEIDPAVRQQTNVIADLMQALSRDRKTIRILEVGCANSLWLPYLAFRYGASQVYGVDYSFWGCVQAKYQLARRNVPGRVWCQDFFTYSEGRKQHFDLVISFGFIEHFSDTCAVLQHMHQILRPGGFMFATFPNLTGIYRPLQSLINRDVVDLHVVMDRDQIRERALRAGFADVEADYIGGAFYFQVLNFQAGQSRLRRRLFNWLRRMLRMLDVGGGWALELMRVNTNQSVSSPYVFVVGKKAEGR